LALPWLFITRKAKIIILPLISAILTAVYVAMDKFYLTVFSSDPVSFSFLSLWIGAIATLLFIFLMQIIKKDKQALGSFIDPNFNRVITPKGEFLKWVIIAGLGATMSAVPYFFIVSISSPTSIIPFTRLVIVYLIIAESLSERDSPSLVEIQSIIMIIIGVFLITTSDIGLDIFTILLVLGPLNIGTMVYTIAQRRAKRLIFQNQRGDSLNIRAWALFFNAVFVSILIIPLITPEIVNNILTINVHQVTFITIDMMVSTFAFIAYIRALGIAKMSVVTAITSFSIVMSIPITLIGNHFYPSVFGGIPTAPLYLFILSIGVILVMTGIITIGLSQVKSYLLIYIEGRAENVLSELVKLKGITSVSAVSGEHLLIAVVKIRSLGKVYRTMVSGLENIKGIKKVITLTNIKEWERL